MGLGPGVPGAWGAWGLGCVAAGSIKGAWGLGCVAAGGIKVSSVELERAVLQGAAKVVEVRMAAVVKP